MRILWESEKTPPFGWRWRARLLGKGVSRKFIRIIARERYLCIYGSVVDFGDGPELRTSGPVTLDERQALRARVPVMLPDGLAY